MQMYSCCIYILINEMENYSRISLIEYVKKLIPCEEHLFTRWKNTYHMEIS